MPLEERYLAAPVDAAVEAVQTPCRPERVGQGGVDAYLYQVVAADSNNRKLLFFTHWVTGGLEEASITIYGGEVENGPWTPVWTPLVLTAETSSGRAWTKTPFMEQVIEQGFPYYKVQIHLRYPVTSIQGGKFTGIYLAALDIDDESLAGVVENGNATGPVMLETVVAPTAVSPLESSVDNSTGSEELRLSATAVSPYQIDLQWTVNPGGRRFWMERSANSAASWQDIAQLGANERFFSDSNIQPGVVYAYRLRLNNPGSGGDYSNVVQITAPALATETAATFTATPSSAMPLITTTPTPPHEQIADAGSERPPETAVGDSAPLPDVEAPRALTMWLVLPFSILLLLLWFIRSRLRP